MTRKETDHDAAMANWEIQARKGVLEFVILLSLRQKEQYGFELISGVARRAGLDVPEGTLYPLLLRLAKDGVVTARIGESGGGAPRKYYSLTPRGIELTRAMAASWRNLNQAVAQMIEESEG